jgi:osmotically inducible protein OsmC
MKTLLTAEAVSTGGRSGSVSSPDGLLNVILGNPLESGAEHRGPSPELLFAAAYSACYHGALLKAAEAASLAPVASRVRALVSLIEDADGGVRLAVELHAQLPGVERAVARQLMDEAHRTCPYSKAMRNDTLVVLVVD